MFINIILVVLVVVLLLILKQLKEVCRQIELNKYTIASSSHVFERKMIKHIELLKSCEYSLEQIKDANLRDN